MSLEIYIYPVVFFLKLGLISFIFSLPLVIDRLRKSLFLDLFLVYLFGAANLILSIFIYYSINYFWDIRKISIVIFTIVVLIVQSIVVIVLGKKERAGDRRGFLLRDNWKWFLLIFTVSTVLYGWINSLYFDRQERKIYNPGYGINHDYIIVLGTSKAFFKYDKDSSLLIKDLYHHCYEAGYPCGGTHISAYFSELFKLDVYLIYQRILTWLSVSIIFVINYFVVNFIRKANLFSRIVLVLVSVASVFNFLSMSFIDASVFGSTAVVPFLLLSIFLTWQYLKEKKDVYLWLVFMVLVDVLYIYTYFGGIYYLLFLLVAVVIYQKKVWEDRKLIKVVTLFLIAFFLPLNLFPSFTFLKKQVTSSVKEISLFKGMNGNMVGFNNPMTSFSIWTSNADYRFYEANYYNTWLFFTLMAPIIFFLVISERENISLGKEILVIGLPFLVVIGVGFWITKSPYQSGKALHWWSDIWPLIFYMLLFKSLLDKRIVVRVLAFSYCLVFFYYSYRGAIFATSYIGKPIVKSNYELMSLEKELCSDESKFLFLGRDEMSKYFLDTCKNVTFYYDRFDNNAVFWDVINLNKLNPVASCSDNSYKLTKIDFTGYKRVLVDKCFEFKNEGYELVKDYKNYRLFRSVK